MRGAITKNQISTIEIILKYEQVSNQNVESPCASELVSAFVDSNCAFFVTPHPARMYLGRFSFESAERFVSFITALRGNTYLERLVLDNIVSGDGSSRALAIALLENKGLVHFGL
jgi:hypothetical protein